MIANASTDIGEADTIMTEMNAGVVHPAHAPLLVAVTGLLFAVCAVATVYFCRTMGDGMDMPGGWTMSMMWMRMPGESWLVSAAMFQLMWLSMMVTMMLPSAVPMLRCFYRARQGGSRAEVATILTACGYFSVWAAVGCAVYIAGAFWADATMRWEAMSRAVPFLTGAALALAGAFQFSRWKWAGLGNCHNPTVQSMPKRAPLRANWWCGVREGGYCLMCCSGLMLILIALGAMNPAAMLAVTAVISLEKLLHRPRPVVHFAGMVAIGTGSVAMLISLF